MIAAIDPRDAAEGTGAAGGVPEVSPLSLEEAAPLFIACDDLRDQVLVGLLVDDHREAASDRELRDRQGRRDVDTAVPTEDDGLVAHYQATGSRDLAEAGCRLAHLDRAFRGVRASRITGAAITEYIVQRQGEEIVSPKKNQRGARRPARSTARWPCCSSCSGSAWSATSSRASEGGCAPLVS
jgi:hypothetical protein